MLPTLPNSGLHPLVAQNSVKTIFPTTLTLVKYRTQKSNYQSNNNPIQCLHTNKSKSSAYNKPLLWQTSSKSPGILISHRYTTRWHKRNSTQSKIRNLERISTLCIHTIRATRHGQKLAPKVGPFAHYYRLFDDFCEILQLERDTILTQKEYLLDHEYRLVPKPPTPPKVTGLRNIVNHYFGESDDEASPSSPQYSPIKSDCSNTSDESEDNEESDSSDSDETDSDNK